MNWKKLRDYENYSKETWMKITLLSVFSAVMFVCCASILIVMVLANQTYLAKTQKDIDTLEQSLTQCTAVKEKLQGDVAACEAKTVKSENFKVCGTAYDGITAFREETKFLISFVYPGVTKECLSVTNFGDLYGTSALNTFNQFANITIDGHYFAINNSRWAYDPMTKKTPENLLGRELVKTADGVEYEVYWYKITNLDSYYTVQALPTGKQAQYTFSMSGSAESEAEARVIKDIILKIIPTIRFNFPKG